MESGDLPRRRQARVKGAKMMNQRTMMICVGNARELRIEAPLREIAFGRGKGVPPILKSSASLAT